MGKGIEMSPGVKMFDFGRPIGKSFITGEDLSKVVVIAKDGRWVTSYPLDKAF